MKKIEFKTGVSNKSFLEGEIVTRINSDVRANPFINRDNEQEVLSICKGFSTTLIEYNNDQMKTKYEQLYEYDFGDKLTKIIGLMKQMHTHKVSHKFNPFTIIDNTKLVVKYNKELYEEVRKHWENDELVLCHNDLLLANIIFNGTDMKLIDFEYSGMNSKYFDIASLISENNLWNFKEPIAKEYGGIDLNVLEKYIFLNDLLWTIWGTEEGHEELIADKRKRLSEY